MQEGLNGKHNNPDQHFAQQRVTEANEYEARASDARRKGSEEIRNTNERFYNNLALFSGGTIALSITYIGYIKSISKSIQHPYLIIISWICLMCCAASSLFYSFVHGYYSHYFHEWQFQNACKVRYEAEAKEFPIITHNTINVQTKQPTSQKDMEEYVLNRSEFAKIYGSNAKKSKKQTDKYLKFYLWIGRIAQSSFLIGLIFLLSFAIANI